MQITNQLKLPKAIVRAIENDPYEASGCDVSTTGLTGPVQKWVLEKRYQNELKVEAADRVAALKGQALHVVLERACPEGSIPEQRYRAEFLGWKVGGQIDLIEEDTIWDYKDTTMWAFQHGPSDEWVEQGNINRLLVYKQTGKLYDSLKNVLFLKDWKRSEMWKRNYPECGVQVIELPVWPIEEAEEFVLKRVELFQAAIALADDQLPSCGPNERWKNDTRCKYYCPAAAKCQQALRNLETF